MPAIAAPRLSVADMIVGEADGYVDVVVTLSAPSRSNVSVGYATQDVAPAYDGGFDYNAVSGTLNFAAGETTKTVRIHLAESASYDSGAIEHFRFNLSRQRTPRWPRPRRRSPSSTTTPRWPWASSPGCMCAT